jgi:hypothetical protein
MIQQYTCTIENSIFQRGPSTDFEVHTYTLDSQKKTLGRNCPLQLGPWALAGGGSANSGEASPGFVRGTVDRQLGAHLGPFCGRR